MLFMLLKLIPHTKGPTVEPSPHVPSELFSVQHTALHTPEIPLWSHLLPLLDFAPRPFLSPLPLLPTSLLGVAQCYFLQEVPWPRAGVNTSAQGLATCCVFFLPLPWRLLVACPSHPLDTELLLQGRNFHSVSPAPSRPSTYMLGVGWRWRMSR